MSIPELNEHGLLPEGVHDCSLSEIEIRFGHFHPTDRRMRLFERLQEFIAAARATDVVTAVIVDGSFATSKDDPSDVDLILIVATGHNFNAVLRPFEYNVVSRRQVRRSYKFDLLVGQDGQPHLAEHIAFFGRVRGRPDLRKGMLRVVL